MPYKAEHKASCANQGRYAVTRHVVEIEDRRGVILDNSDRGKVVSVECASCGAPAEWK